LLPSATGLSDSPAGALASTATSSRSTNPCTSG
jgi:hypothetical protein